VPSSGEFPDMVLKNTIYSDMVFASKKVYDTPLKENSERRGCLWDGKIVGISICELVGRSFSLAIPL
jgi:hypothetical protein